MNGSRGDINRSVTKSRSGKFSGQGGYLNPFEVEYVGIFSFRNEAWQVLQTRAASKSMLENSAARIVTQLIGAGFRHFVP